ncbi:MAG: M20/M25/M40 family metallo-hydrolase [Alphaproteobacteria bacterium]|nr:M20/M25/M40 family metallo-hydrolase [Alphaproteobacteria bacterium]
MDVDVDTTAAVAARVAEALPRTLERLKAYLAVPAISCEPAHHADVRRLAERIRDDLQALGLDRARVLDVTPGEGVAMPLVAAEWLHAGPDVPTVLIYGHLDLQPVGEPEWTTSPHEAVQRGDRLFARGAADDMGGWVSHLAAVEAWLAETGGLPCNLKLVIEGEEEIGSPFLERFMDEHPDAFEADVMVLTDCENPGVDVPGLTVSLRGLMEVELVCEALGADVHSGLWGNMAPDPTIALFRLVARLTDEDGRLRFGRVHVDDARKAAAQQVPIDAQTVREGAHLLDRVDPLPVRDRSIAEWLWWQPAVTVIATTLPPPSQKKNAIRRRASATLSVRVAPGQTADEMLAILRGVLLVDPPAGVIVRLETVPGWGGSWLYTPRGPAFEAADRAYVAGWGRPLVQVGIGGSIPFVAMFGQRFSDLPLILNGVLDPLSTAHGPNESLHLGVFEKMLVTNVHLYAELGALSPAALAGGA